MRISGGLKKMVAEPGKPVSYRLPIGGQLVELNEFIGQTVEFHYSGQITCIHCSRPTTKSYSQGYCYPCCQRLARCDLCIVKPETCHYEHGTCREPEWGERYCLQPHVVYLANSSGLKVGVTREQQIPTRWIDQGAVQALPIFSVDSRHDAGLVEVMLARHVSDRTNWRVMLRGEQPDLDLLSQRDLLLNQCARELDSLQHNSAHPMLQSLGDAQPIELSYPISRLPEKVVSISLEKTPRFSAELQGIKGQYLLLDCGVLNIRRHTGFEVSVTLGG